MSVVRPIVRYLLVCEDVRIDPDRRQPVTIVGLLSGLRSRTDPAFPFVQRELHAFLHLSGCRGEGSGRIDVEQADRGIVVSGTRPRPLTFPHDPLAVFGIAFRLKDCVFPDPGLYWVRFWYNDDELARQSLVIR